MTHDTISDMKNRITWLERENEFLVNLRIEHLQRCKQKALIWLSFAVFMLIVPCVLIVYAQAKNNKQLIYDLNVSQTTVLIQKDIIERQSVRIDELDGAVYSCIKATK